MSLVKKNTLRRSSAERVENKRVIITKSTTPGNSPFAKKIETINSLLNKAKLLP